MFCIPVLKLCLFLFCGCHFWQPADVLKCGQC